MQLLQQMNSSSPLQMFSYFERETHYFDSKLDKISIWRVWWVAGWQYLPCAWFCHNVNLIHMPFLSRVRRRFGAAGRTAWSICWQASFWPFRGCLSLLWLSEIMFLDFWIRTRPGQTAFRLSGAAQLNHSFISLSLGASQFWYPSHPADPSSLAVWNLASCSSLPRILKPAPSISFTFIAETFPALLVISGLQVDFWASSFFRRPGSDIIYPSHFYWFMVIVGQHWHSQTLFLVHFLCFLGCRTWRRSQIIVVF